MKRIILFTSLLSVILISCSKKDNSTPSSSSNATNTTTPSQQVTATVNGVSFVSAAKYGFSKGSMGSGVFITYFLTVTTDYTNSAKPHMQLNFPGNKIHTGSFPLVQDYVNIGAIYSENGTDYNAAGGTINITAIDTADRTISKFTATFSFNTDTIAGKHFSITNGNFKF